MITPEEYDLSYNLYIETKAMNTRRSIIDIKALKESSDDIILEDTKDNIKKFTEKIIKGIQAAWEKFKDNVNRTTFKWKEEEITKAINDNDIHVTVKDWIEYDPSVLDTIQIKVLDFNTMKADLTDEDTFMTKYYTNIYPDKSKSILQNIKDKVAKSKADKHEVTKDEIVSMFEYMKKHKEFLSKVEKDLDAINKASNSTTYITNLVTSTPNNTTTKQEAFYGYFTEDEDPKPTIEKNDNSSTDMNATVTTTEEKKDPQKEAEKAVQVYFKCISQILSAEMKVSRDIYHFYNSVVSAHMNNVKGGSTETKKEEDNAPQVAKTADTGAPQITK